MGINNSNVGDSTELKARGNWNNIKGQAKQKWAGLTDDDLTYEEGKQDEWFGKLQQKTGHTIDDIKNWFNEKTDNATASSNGTELRARGNWNQVKGEAKQKWGNLTDDDLSYEEGKQDEWFGKLQEKTGHTVDDIKAWFNRAF